MTTPAAPQPQSQPGSQPDAQPTRARAVRAAWAVAAVFIINGIAFASWAARVPAVKAALNLNPAMLGFLLAFMTAGAIVGLLAAGNLHHVWSNRSIVAIAATFWAVGALGIGFGTDVFYSIELVGAGLAFAGLGIGAIDVSMNVEGARVEQLLGWAVMPRLHAAYSFGTVITLLGAVLIVYFDVSVWLNMLVLALLLPPLAFIATRNFLPPLSAITRRKRAEENNTIPADRSVWKEPRTIAIGLMTVLFAIGDSVANDWLPVAVESGHNSPQWVGVALLDLFLIAVTIARFFGGNLIDRFGRINMLRVSSVATFLGVLLLVFAPLPLSPLAVILWGFGIANAFPVGMSAASDDPERAAARVSAVGAIAYTAFLAAPPLVGLIGNHIGSLRALLIVAVAALLAQLFVKAVRPLPGIAKQTDSLVAEPPQSPQSPQPPQSPAG